MKYFNMGYRGDIIGEPRHVFFSFHDDHVLMLGLNIHFWAVQAGGI